MIEDYTRVTEVLYPFSGLSSVPLPILHRKRDLGSKVHEICDSMIQNLGEFGLDDHVDGYIQSFKKWYKGKYFMPKPDRFYCDKLMLTGECDGIYQDGNDLVLVDFKTSAKESKTWALQGSAYAYLARQEGFNITKIEFVKLCKDGSDAKVFVYQENFELFQKCLEIYRYFFKNKEDSDALEWL